MRLTAPHIGDGPWVERDQVGGGTIDLLRRLGEEVASRQGIVGISAGAVEHVRVLRKLGNGKCVSLLATPFTQRMPASHVDWRAATQIRQGKIDSAVAAESRPQERE